MNKSRDEALQRLGYLLDLLSRKCLVERILTNEEVSTLTRPIGPMDWDDKKKRADALIDILATSKSGDEILERARWLEDEENKYDFSNKKRPVRRIDND